MSRERERAINNKLMEKYTLASINEEVLQLLERARHAARNMEPRKPSFTYEATDLADYKHDRFECFSTD